MLRIFYFIWCRSALYAIYREQEIFYLYIQDLSQPLLRQTSLLHPHLNSSSFERELNCCSNPTRSTLLNIVLSLVSRIIQDLSASNDPRYIPFHSLSSIIANGILNDGIVLPIPGKSPLLYRHSDRADDEL
jgi:hypothetical protein